MAAVRQRLLRRWDEGLCVGYDSPVDQLFPQAGRACATQCILNHFALRLPFLPRHRFRGACQIAGNEMVFFTNARHAFLLARVTPAGSSGNEFALEHLQLQLALDL